MKKNPTIKDVAELAGVSFKTVSRVINNEPAVSNDVKERVNFFIKKLNYQPNRAARLLKSKPFSIAFVYDNPNSNYVIDMQSGILKACRANNFELVIHPANSESQDIAMELLNMVGSGQIGGIILTPPMSEDPRIIEQLQKSKAKVVRILSGYELKTDIAPAVYVDDESASMNATRYLIDLGHRDIAFIGGQDIHQSNKGRKAGYLAALQTAGIKPNGNLILDGNFTFESGIALSEIVLNLKTRPTAVVAANDEIAAGTLFAARTLGLKIPEDLSIIGFENSPFSKQSWPSLTTVDQPTAKIAETAAELLIEMMQTDDIDNSKSIGFELSIVHRDSTAPPAHK